MIWRLSEVGKLVLLLFLIFLPLPSYSQPERQLLNIDQLIDEALQNNPEILAAKKRLEVFKEKVPQSFALEDPMKKIVSVLTVLFLRFFAMTSLSLAQHGHGTSKGGTMKMETKDVLVEGIKVSFMVMPNESHKKMLKDMKMKEDIEPGTTHNITVVLQEEKTQKEITNAQINMKVVDPKGKDQIKMLKYEEMMKSYDGYFNLPEKGKYQVMVLFQIEEKKRTAGIYYEIK